MREIKFRAWDKQLRRMGILDGQNSFCIFEDDVFEVMQYTGLKDKNGKEIYEGDIIKYIDPFARPEVDHIQGEVFFGSGEYSIHAMGADDQYNYQGWLIKNKYFTEPLTQNSCEVVIGNIYENPELLK